MATYESSCPNRITAQKATGNAAIDWECMVSSASYLVVEDMHMQVVAVAAVIVVSSSSDSSNASNEVRADISATVAGDMHAWNSVGSYSTNQSH